MYNFFNDSANIYSSLNILYMPYDTTNNSLNNRVALPNKLYEAMYFRVSILTSKDTYLSELVERYKIGRSVECCNKKELIKTLNNFDFDIIKNFENLDKGIYIGDEDYKELKRYILE